MTPPTSAKTPNKNVKEDRMALLRCPCCYKLIEDSTDDKIPFKDEKNEIVAKNTPSDLQPFSKNYCPECWLHNYRVASRRT